MACLLDVVGDRLFAQDVQAGFQTLNGRFEVVTAIFDACGRDGDRIELLVLEKVVDAVVSRDVVTLCRFVCAFFDDVADGDQFDSASAL